MAQRTVPARLVTLFFGVTIMVTPVKMMPEMDPLLAPTLESQSTAVVLLTMADEPCHILEQFKFLSFSTREERINSVVSALKQHAAESQAEVVKFLGNFSMKNPINFTSMWITNVVCVFNFHTGLLLGLQTMGNVRSITVEQAAVLTDSPQQRRNRRPTRGNAWESSKILALGQFQGTAWGVKKIQADFVQSGGNLGQNVVVGLIDSGVRVTHEALRYNFRGPYGWYDPNHRSTVPEDPVGHGTHVAGVLCGRTRGIGVAPRATWMACVGCQTRNCFEADLLACGQFMMCPTDVNGQNPDCSKAPHVINNSWSIGAGGNPFFTKVVNAWRAAGIIPVFAIGNSGPACNTTQSPGDYENVIGVGATDINDKLGTFSSAGPAIFTNAYKPDLVGPGVRVLSAGNETDTDYEGKSGTSGATPHVTGIIILMLSANPSLTYDQIKTTLESTATHATTDSGLACGGVPSNQVPNYEVGYGRVNALTAVNRARGLNA